MIKNKELDDRRETPPGLCLMKPYQNSNATSKGRPLGAQCLTSMTLKSSIAAAAAAAATILSHFTV